LDIFRWSTPLYTRRVELSAVSKDKVRLEAQHSIPPFSLHDLLGEPLPLFYIIYKNLGPPYGTCFTLPCWCLKFEK